MEEIMSGICGAEVRWSLDRSSGRMTVSGTGPMTDYEAVEEIPWHPWRAEIRELVVEEGVTTVGDYAFRGSGLERFTLAPSVEIIGNYSLSECEHLKKAELPEGVRVISSKAFSFDGGLESVRIPLTLEAVDMRAFDSDVNIGEVIYAGTEARWKQIRFSPTKRGNRCLTDADIRFEGETADGQSGAGKTAPAGHSGGAAEAIPVFELARDILNRGGDGKLHILAPDISTPDILTKPGDCTFLIFPDGQTMMIDAGVPDCGERVMKALRSLGLTSLDYFVLSHPHLDHVGNALAAAKYIYGQGGTIGTYFYMGHQFQTLEPAFAEYLRERGTDMQNHLLAGETRQFGEVRMEVLGPTAQELEAADSITAEAINSLSLILKFTYGDASYLTSGDLYRRDERRVAKTYGSRLKATVMKANHHGVYTSSSDEWLETVSPRMMIVEGDDIGGTVLAEKASARGIGYYAVALDGDVLVSLDRDGSAEVQAACGGTCSVNGPAR